jgi:hypothetical protein
VADIHGSKTFQLRGISDGINHHRPPLQSPGLG